MREERKNKVKLIVKYWNNTIEPDILNIEYPNTDVNLDEYRNAFKTILLWLTFDPDQIESIFDEEYREG